MSYTKDVQKILKNKKLNKIEIQEQLLAAIRAENVCTLAALIFYTEDGDKYNKGGVT